MPPNKTLTFSPCIWTPTHILLKSDYCTIPNEKTLKLHIVQQILNEVVIVEKA
jgi:hypothetical protein